MAEAKLDFSANTAVAQKELDKLTKGLASAREEIRKLNQQSKESKQTTDSWSSGMDRLKTQNDRWAQGMKRLQDMQPKKTVAGISLANLHEATTGFAQMATGLLGVGAAVGAVTNAYGHWNQRIDEIIQGHTELSTSIVRTLAESGKLQLGPEISKWAKSQSGATPAQAMATIGGVMQSGETLSDQRTMAVSTEIAKLGPTGIDLAKAGGLAADVADIVGENVSAKDVANITVGLKQQLRGKADLFSGPKVQKQIERLKRNTGISGETALDYAVVAAQAEGGAEALSVAGMKPGERTADQRKMYKAVFSPEALAAARASRESFKASNLAAGELSALGTFGSGQESLKEQELAQEKARTQDQYGAFESERKRIRETIQERANQGGMLRGIGNYIDQSFAGVNNLVFGKQMTTEAEISAARSTGLISQSETQQMIAALREAAAASREAAKANSARNVDAHTE
jgi:hypothetical protein